MIMQVRERLDTADAKAAVGSVKAWQHILNGCGYNPRLKLNGYLDESTTKATKRFQQNLGLPVTGEIDLKTWQAGLAHNKYEGWSPQVPPEDVPRSPANSSMTEIEKYNYYRSIINAQNNNFKSGNNQRNLLGFRKETKVYDNHGQGKYDDFLAMLWKTSSGQPRVREYSQFCTEPIGHYRGTIGDDANGDGVMDLGRTPEGYYEYKVGPLHNRLGRNLVPLREMYSIRDINNDGKFSTREPRTSAGKTILFHQGGDLTRGGNTGSAGCQTLPKSDFNNFWNDLHSEGDPGVIGYTLVRREE